MDERKKTLISIQFFVVIGFFCIQMFGGETKGSKRFGSRAKNSTKSATQLTTYKDKSQTPEKISEFHKQSQSIMLGNFNTDCTKLNPLISKMKVSTNKYALDFKEIEENFNSQRLNILKNKNDFSSVTTNFFDASLVDKKIGMGNADIYSNNYKSLQQNVKDLKTNVDTLSSFLNQQCTTQMLLGGFESHRLDKFRNWLHYSLYLLDRWVDTKHSNYIRKSRRKNVKNSFNVKEYISFKKGLDAGIQLVQIIDSVDPKPTMHFLNKAYGFSGKKMNKPENRFGEFIRKQSKYHASEKEIQEFLSTFDALSKFQVLNTNIA